MSKIQIILNLIKHNCIQLVADLNLLILFRSYFYHLTYTFKIKVVHILLPFHIFPQKVTCDVRWVERKWPQTAQ